MDNLALRSNSRRKLRKAAQRQLLKVFEPPNIDESKNHRTAVKRSALKALRRRPMPEHGVMGASVSLEAELGKEAGCKYQARSTLAGALAIQKKTDGTVAEVLNVILQALNPCRADLNWPRTDAL
eukprot:CAMPEP_0204269842 /NCGR_PEP_ID=MMETSP0468-20130131/17376_1 /ASSEMBLY_ACC=CAM_ASM_000383 /TAXON_ID=2969 /ORGANISM="Oxyrrhis marina" /LENGTH=124 /DNA_ID=CAMNT_0051245291 /DNA_START=83 /DNA_END=459 /DNA_ORIENTATION=-